MKKFNRHRVERIRKLGAAKAQEKAAPSGAPAGGGLLPARSPSPGLGSTTSTSPEPGGTVSDDEDGKPFFRAADFKASHEKVSDAVVDSIKKVLSLPTAARTERELEVMEPLSNSVLFLRQLRPSQRLALYRACLLLQLPKGKKLYNQGDEADALYIVVKGGVALKVLEERVIPGGPKVIVPVTVRSVGGLETFGETRVNLEGEPEARASSAVTATPCILLCVRKTDMDAALHDYQSRTLQENVAFLEKVSLFRHWPEERLRQLATVSRLENHPSHTLVYRQGGACPDLYMVRLGQVRMLRQVQIPTHDGPVSATTEYRPHIIEVERVETGGFFGDVENVRQMHSAVNTVETMTNVKLLVVPQSEFRHMMRMYPSVKRDMQSYLNQRYPPDEYYAGQVQGTSTWDSYKRGITMRLSRTVAPSTKGLHFKSEVPVPDEPTEDVVSIVATAIDPEGRLAHPSMRRPGLAATDRAGSPRGISPRGIGATAAKSNITLEPGLVAIRRRRRVLAAQLRMKGRHAPAGSFMRQASMRIGLTLEQQNVDTAFDAPAGGAGGKSPPGRGSPNDFKSPTSKGTFGKKSAGAEEDTDDSDDDCVFDAIKYSLSKTKVVIPRFDPRSKKRDIHAWREASAPAAAQLVARTALAFPSRGPYQPGFMSPMRVGSAPAEPGTVSSVGSFDGGLYLGGRGAAGTSPGGARSAFVDRGGCSAAAPLSFETV